MARPTKFTEETIERLCEAIALGETYVGACVYAGIAFDTFNEWRKGEYPRGADKDLKAAFSERLTRAEAEASMAALRSIRRAAMDGDWRAAAWWLERRRPESFGRKPVEISGPNGGPIEIRALAEKIAATDGLNVDEVLAEAEELIARGGAV